LSTLAGMCAATSGTTRATGRFPAAWPVLAEVSHPLRSQGIVHSLRHSAATWARAGGAKLDTLAGMLGHASVTTTQMYAHVVDQMTENPARYLEAVMGSVAS
jgi:integrase